MRSRSEHDGNYAGNSEDSAMASFEIFKGFQTTSRGRR